MIPDRPVAATAPPTADYSRKARMLLDLLGRERLESLSRNGLGTEILAALPDAPNPAPEQGPPPGLIARLRRKGLLEDGPANPKTPLSDLLARALDPGTELTDEHPAVVAYLLRDQPSALRARVLRALPGHRARAVIRFLGSGRPAVSDKAAQRLR